MAVIKAGWWAEVLAEQAQKSMDEHYKEMAYFEEHGKHSSEKMRRRYQSDYERGFDDGSMAILVHLAQRCRLAAQMRRRAKDTERQWEAYAAWAESYNALQVAKRIYNDRLNER